MVCHGSCVSYFSSALIKQHEQGGSKELICLPVGRGIATVPDGRAEAW